MRRREFITLLGGAATAWPLVARAQQAAMPVIGFLGHRVALRDRDAMTPFRQGLKDAGHVGKNVAIQYLWAEGQLERLPELAAELVSRRVDVIVNPLALGRRSWPKRLPRNSRSSSSFDEDPVKLGLVASLARPGGNLTGVNFFLRVSGKAAGDPARTLPGAARIAVLVIRPCDDRTDVERP